MKKRIVLLLLTAVLMPVLASAIQFQVDEKMAIERHEIKTEDWYAGAELISFYGSALQDVWAMASKAFFWGVIAQDLNLLAGEGEIKGEIGDDLRVAGNKIAVSAKISGSTMMLGNQLIIQNEANLGSDLLAVGNTVILNGTIQGPVNIKCEQLVINGTVMGDVVADCRLITLGNQSGILGHLTYSATQRLDKTAISHVKGTVNWKKAATKPEGQFVPYNMDSWWFAGKLFFRLTVFIGLLALGILIIMLMPEMAGRYVTVLKARPLAGLGWGVLTVFGGPLLILVLLITIIGIPFAVIAGVFYAILLILAKIGIAFWLGRQLLKAGSNEQLKTVISFIIGFIFISALSLIPILGGLINMVIFLFGTGVIWLVGTQGKTAAEPKSQAPALPAQREADEPVVVEVPVKATEPKKKETVKQEWKPSTPAFLQSEPKKKTSKKPGKVKQVTKVKKMTKKAAKSTVKKAAAKKVIKKTVKKPVKRVTKKAKK